MLYTLGTKVPFERRDSFYVAAANLNATPSSLLRALVYRFLDGGDAPTGNIYRLLKRDYEQNTKAFVLIRFLSESIDKESTEYLLRRTEEFLKENSTSGRTNS